MSRTEIFDKDSVASTMSAISEDFKGLSDVIDTINTSITEALGSPDKAMYGDAGDKVLATWDENCSTLSSFIGIFGNWSSMVTSIANEYGGLQSGTATVEDEDKDALQTIANANKTRWLNTKTAQEAYTGSESKYKDFETDIEYTETKKLNQTIDNNDGIKIGRVVEYTDEDGNTIKEYYSLAGALIGKAIKDPKGKIKYKDSDGRTVSKITTKELEDQEKAVSKAQETIKDNIKKREEIAKKGTKVYKALMNYKGELLTADEKYTSENTFMTISNKVVNGSNLRITHIVVNDPSQLTAIQANGNYGNGGESIYSMANRTDNLVVAVTGGFFKSDGKQNLIGDNNMVISNGKVVDKVSDYTGGHEICVDRDGKIF